MSGFYYAFQTKGLQRWVLEGGKFVDIIGASELIDAMARPEGNDLLDAALSAASVVAVEPDDPNIGAAACVLTRRASAGVGLWFPYHDQKGRDAALALARRLRAGFSLAAQLALPDLEWVDALIEAAEVGDAVEQGEAAMGGARNLVASPAPARPALALAAARSGRAATARDALRDNELIDAAGEAKRDEARRLREGRSQNSFERRFLDGEDHLKNYRWAVDFEQADPKRRDYLPFPFRYAHGKLHPVKTVGVVHADGNGMGRALMGLVADVKGQAGSERLLWEVSRNLASASLGAARRATTNTLKSEADERDAAALAAGRKEVKNLLAARPVVLGGDDVTMLVRGDLALRWTQAFLIAFAEETKTKFSALAEAVKAWNEKFGELVAQRFGDGFTAGAGVVFVKASQPYDQAYSLCESLAKAAKDAAKASAKGDRAPSLLAFHRVTQSCFDDYDGADGIVARELTLPGGLSLTAGPYAIDADGGARFASLGALNELVDVLSRPDFPASGLRATLTSAERGRGASDAAYARWRQVMSRRDKAGLKSFDDTLTKLATNGEDCQRTVFVRQTESGFATPLADAMHLVAASLGDDA